MHIPGHILVWTFLDCFCSGWFWVESFAYVNIYGSNELTSITKWFHSIEKNEFLCQTLHFTNLQLELHCRWSSWSHHHNNFVLSYFPYLKFHIFLFLYLFVSIHTRHKYIAQKFLTFGYRPYITWESRTILVTALSWEFIQNRARNTYHCGPNFSFFDLQHKKYHQSSISHGSSDRSVCTFSSGEKPVAALWTIFL